MSTIRQTIEQIQTDNQESFLGPERWIDFGVRTTMMHGNIKLEELNGILFHCGNMLNRISRDGGNTWENLSGLPAGNRNIRSPFIDESNRLYVQDTGDGLYRSTNNGASFSRITTSGLTTNMIHKMGFHRLNSTTAWFFAAGYLSNDGGLFRSADGVTWQKMTATNTRAIQDYVIGNGVTVFTCSQNATVGGLYRLNGNTVQASNRVGTAINQSYHRVFFAFGTFMAFSNNADNPALWSTDGLTWNSSGVNIQIRSNMVLVPRTIIQHENFVYCINLSAGGTEPNEGSIWRTSDGRSWTRFRVFQQNAGLATDGGLTIIGKYAYFNSLWGFFIYDLEEQRVAKLYNMQSVDFTESLFFQNKFFIGVARGMQIFSSQSNQTSSILSRNLELRTNNPIFTNNLSNFNTQVINSNFHPFTSIRVGNRIIWGSPNGFQHSTVANPGVITNSNITNLNITQSGNISFRFEGNRGFAGVVEGTSPNWVRSIWTSGDGGVSWARISGFEDRNFNGFPFFCHDRWFVSEMTIGSPSVVNRFMHSTNGTTWSAVTVPTGTIADFSAWNTSHMVRFNNRFIFATGDRIYHSTTGTNNWTAITTGFDNNNRPSRVFIVNNILITAGSGNAFDRLFTSTDGLTWTRRHGVEQPNGCHFFNGRYYVLDRTVLNIVSSTDFVNWRFEDWAGTVNTSLTRVEDDGNFLFLLYGQGIDMKAILANGTIKTIMTFGVDSTIRASFHNENNQNLLVLNSLNNNIKFGVGNPVTGNFNMNTTFPMWGAAQIYLDNNRFVVGVNMTRFDQNQNSIRGVNTITIDV